MALTPSTMLELGTIAPNFSLPAPDNKIWSLADLANGKPFLVIFMCNHCPYVIHIREALAKITHAYQQKGIAIIAINSNDVENYPEDHPNKMQQEINRNGYTFPYVYDASQSVAKAYRAACTPDFFIFDKDQHLVYRGQFDDSRPGNNTPVTGQDLCTALDHILANEPLTEEQKPSIGCNIKWRPGNAPAYFG